MVAVVKIKGVPFDFGAETLIIPPLSLGSFEQLQERLTETHENAISPAYIALVVDTAHAALRRNYPELTRAQVSDMIDVANMQDVMACCMDVSGARRKEAETAANGEPPGE